MYAYVKYKSDNSEECVPLNFIKDFDENNFENVVSHVFWSPNPQDTPEIELQRQGKILCESEFKRTKKLVPGYYEAVVLHIADTEEKLLSALSSKELRKNIRKVTDVKSSAAEKNTKTSVKSIMKKGKKKTIAGIKRNLDESDDDTDDTLISKTTHDAEIDALKSELNESKRKYGTLKEKYKQLQGKFDKVFELNISLQERLNKPNFQETLGISTNPETNSTPIISISSKSLSPATNSFIKPILPLSSKNVFVATSNLENNTPPPILSENVAPNTLTFLQVQNENQTPATVPDSNQEIHARDFHLSEEKMELLFKMAKPGVQGDSLFVKNLAVAVYGLGVLATSSVTGQKCRRKKDGDPKPQLCQERLLYIKGLFGRKIALESQDKEEMDKRMKKFNSYVAEKIATIVRYKL